VRFRRLDSKLIAPQTWKARRRLFTKAAGVIGMLVLTPHVRAKRATTAGRAGQQAQDGPQAQRSMAGVACRWRSA